MRNRQTGALLKVQPIPPMLLDLMLHGGLYPQLEKQEPLEPIAARA